MNLGGASSARYSVDFGVVNFIDKMPELQQKPFQKRQVAYKVRISDILNGKFTKDEFSAGYIKLSDCNVSRVNVIATVVYKPENSPSYNNAVIDDGTGKILLRSFENMGAFPKMDVGDVVLVIGKIREFNDEMYIVPEIFKKLDNFMWMNVRGLELRKGVDFDNYPKSEIKVSAEEVNNEEICSIIRKLDNGDGAFVEDVIKNLKYDAAEKMLNILLEKGNIFEIKPGKLKVLE